MNRMKRMTVYLCMCLLIVVMSWEYQRGVSASVMTATSEIPEEALRLRILAHSDTPQDQWLKREIRDEVVEQITIWVKDLKDIDEARKEVQLSLEDINNLVKEAIESRGFTYSAKVEYGEITFPSKLYGNKLYPAGQYEGLLITIGEGQGDNWWCVLFPPLCFVDFGTGEVTDSNQEAEENQSKDESDPGVTNAGSESGEEQVEVRFFLAEVFQKLKSFFA
jgi:stage II sporulation protein R